MPALMRKTWISVALAALALAGCAGGEALSQSEFEAMVKAARDRVDSAVTHVSRSQSQQQLINRLDQAALAVDEAAADLDDAGAAEGFEDETSRLVKLLRDLSTDLAATAAQLRDPAFAESLLPQTRALQFESWTKANGILRDLRRQGIDVKPWA